jgi:hypothetical protein
LTFAIFSAYDKIEVSGVAVSIINNTTEMMSANNMKHDERGKKRYRLKKKEHVAYGPFFDYAWGEAYEQMHETMYRQRHQDCAPSAADDNKLVAMWEKAYDAYLMTCRSFDMIDDTRDRLQLRLGALNEFTEDYEAKRAYLLERIEDLEYTTEMETAMTARLDQKVEWLETIDEEFARRPWLRERWAALQGSVLRHEQSQ